MEILKRGPIFALFLVIQLMSITASGLDDKTLPEKLGLEDLLDGPTLEKFLRSKIGDIKAIMRSGDPNNRIPSIDPYLQDDKLSNTFYVHTSIAEATVKVNNVKVTGLSNFELTSLSVDVNAKTMSLGLLLPKLVMEGDYKADGTYQLVAPSRTFRTFQSIPVGPVQIDGSGPFTATLVRPTASIMLQVNYEDRTGVSVSGSSVSVDYDDVEFDLQGFMPGKPLAPVILRAIKARSRNYFEDSKDELEERLSEFMSLTLNSVLDDVFNEAEEPSESEEDGGHTINKRQACGSGNMNSYIDQVLTNARPVIRAKAEPVRLKNLKKGVSLYDGRVNGLSSIRRTGNVILSCSSSALSLRVNFGFGRVSAGYRWKKRLLFVKLKGKAEIRFRSIGVSATISQPRRPGAHPVINSLNLSISGLRVHLSGLSLAGHIIAALISVIGGIFKKAVANALEKPIKKALQNELNKITLPF